MNFNKFLPLTRVLKLTTYFTLHHFSDFKFIGIYLATLKQKTQWAQ